MKTTVLAPFLLCTLGVAQAGDVASVEDDDLKPVPSEVAAGVRAAESAPETRTCGLAGRAIRLARGTKVDAYLVTTTDACVWGAAVGPIWVVYQRAGAYQVTKTGGYSLHVASRHRHGMADFSVHAATAGWSSTHAWHFDGTVYREAAPAPRNRKASNAERLVLALQEVSSWAERVKKAGRGVAVHEEASTGTRGCREVTLYEDAATHLSRFGTWQVCGRQVKRQRDDE
jgi:hypothetical protein